MAKLGCVQIANNNKNIEKVEIKYHDVIITSQFEYNVVGSKEIMQIPITL